MRTVFPEPQPPLAAVGAVVHGGGEDDACERHGVAECPVEFGHVLQVHAVDADDADGYGGEGGDGADEAQVKPALRIDRSPRGPGVPHWLPSPQIVAKGIAYSQFCVLELLEQSIHHGII